MARADVLPASSALKRRTLTALTLVPIAIAAVLWLPTPLFAIAFAGVMILATWEWVALAGLRRVRERALYVAAVCAAMMALWVWPQGRVWIFAVSSVWWLLQSLILLRITSIRPVAGIQWWLLPIGLLLLVAPWAALIDLHARAEVGPGLVLFLLFLMWTADSMAYFVGRALGTGRAKLAPVLSPGKTWIGVYGGMVGGVVCGLVFAWIISASPGSTLAILLLCVVAVVISVVGDLYESLLKRRRGVKDSSHLLPGHGGMLDRIDSLIAAAPVFALGLTWIGVSV